MPFFVYLIKKNMKKLVFLLVATGMGYYLYKSKAKKEEIIIPKEKDLAHNDYTVYFDCENVEKEELFV